MRVCVFVLPTNCWTYKNHSGLPGKHMWVCVYERCGSIPTTSVCVFTGKPRYEVGSLWAFPGRRMVCSGQQWELISQSLLWVCLFCISRSWGLSWPQWTSLCTVCTDNSCAFKVSVNSAGFLTAVSAQSLLTYHWDLTTWLLSLSLRCISLHPAVKL